mmetsp:Transcript_12104/g.28700  ORF Transcript_12104/g.28700 Transcript_12104/m.28700 type:complete len:432 (-) Transcript_12104:1126-2421(-)
MRLLEVRDVGLVLCHKVGPHLLERLTVRVLQALHLVLKAGCQPIPLVPRLCPDRLQLLLRFLARLRGLLQVLLQVGHLVVPRAELLLGCFQLGLQLRHRLTRLRLGALHLLLHVGKVLLHAGELLVPHLHMRAGLLCGRCRLRGASLGFAHGSLELLDPRLVLLGLGIVLRLLLLGNADKFPLGIRELLLLGLERALELRDSCCGSLALGGGGAAEVLLRLPCYHHGELLYFRLKLGPQLLLSLVCRLELGPEGLLRAHRIAMLARFERSACLLGGPELGPQRLLPRLCRFEFCPKLVLQPLHLLPELLGCRKEGLGLRLGLQQSPLKLPGTGGSIRLRTVCPLQQLLQLLSPCLLVGPEGRKLCLQLQGTPLQLLRSPPGSHCLRLKATPQLCHCLGRAAGWSTAISPILPHPCRSCLPPHRVELGESRC